MSEFIVNYVIENNYQAIVLTIFILITATKYARYFLATNIEMIFLKQKDAQKKDLSTAMLLFVVFSACNALLSYNDTFIAIEVIVMLVTFMVWGLSKIYYKVKKKDGREFASTCELFIIIVGIPAVIGSLSTGTINRINISAIGGLAETILLWLNNNGFMPKISEFMLCNEEENLFIYKKISDDYLLCGDRKDLNEAEIKPLNIHDIYEGKYYLRKVKDIDLEGSGGEDENNKEG